MLGFGYGGYRISESAGIRALAENGERQLELHARTVESEISKYTYLPSLLELERSVSHLLTDPTPYRRNQVNAYLEGLNRRAGSRAVYLLDTNGRVLATSNWSDPDSYLGEDLSFRAYWQDAMKGKPGRFYGIGSTRGEPGYYLAHGLVHGGRIIGVAVVKVKMDALEERWEKARLEAFVSDENGIIILSSNPALRLKAVRSLSADDKRLARSMQYYWWALNEWQPLLRAAGRRSGEAQFPADEQHPRGEAVTYLAQTRALNDTPWNLTLLSPLEDLRRDAVRNGMLAAIGFALLAFLLIAWNERRKVLATRLAAREALQRANGELEVKIAERTADLQASNARLTAEIHERQQAEDTLRKAQDELVQAGKLAVIGQMSTSIAHELNQPLAALRTLSGNTVRFLQRGKLETASTNLATINELVDRMGRITASLRAFARRSDDAGQASLAKAVDAALLILHGRLEQDPPTLHRHFDDVRLGIDQTRLEQILVNLLANALDAMSGQADRQLWLEGRREEERYVLRVRDNGPVSAGGARPPVRTLLHHQARRTWPGPRPDPLGQPGHRRRRQPQRAAPRKRRNRLRAEPVPGSRFPDCESRPMNEPLSVLIVEDDPHVLLGCQQALELEDIPCIGVGSAEEALQRVDRDFAGIVVSDIRLPGIDGLTLLERLKSLDPSLPVVLITGHGDISMAVQAMHAGAYDFMEKPFSPERLVEVARRALEQRGLAREVSALRRQLAGRQDLAQRIIGRSPAIQALRELIANVGDTSANVLILGETGTGKELVARCLHDYSRRHQHAFVALNCGGLPENLFDSEIFGHEAHAFTGANKRRIGKIEHANGGTLFLDEIESMPVNLQIKLLRVLQEHTLERLGSNQSIPVDCRVIAATKADLAAMGKSGQFRSDLYYRLNVVSLELPALRDRREDILLLFEHFLQQSSLRFDRPAPELDRATVASLMAHDWPGNVRELRNVAERFALGLPVFNKGGQAVQTGGPRFAEAVEAFEKALLGDALARHHGNLTQASQDLGMAKTTLFDKVKKYGLQ